MTDNFHGKYAFKNKTQYIFSKTKQKWGAVVDVILLNLSSVVNYIRWRSDLSAETSFFQTPGLFMGVWFGY